MFIQLSRVLSSLIGRIELHREEGQTFVEYALLVVFIALVAVLGAAVLGSSISNLFTSIAGSL